MKRKQLRKAIEIRRRWKMQKKKENKKKSYKINDNNKEEVSNCFVLIKKTCLENNDRLKTNVKTNEQTDKQTNRQTDR